LHEGLRLCFVWIMVWAGSVVALRAVFHADRITLLWGFAGLLAATAAGVSRAIHKVPSTDAVRAAIDRHGRMGGLLMASGDTDIGRWGEQMVELPLPVLTWRMGRQGKLLAASVLFLIVSFLMPDRYLPTTEASLQIDGEMQKLTEKLQVLKQEQILPPEKARVLEKDLSRVRHEAEANDPAKTMEALDHVEQSFSKAASQAAESAIKQTETASKASDLAAALEAARDKMDPKQCGEAMKELARLTEEAAAENQALAESLSEELKDAGQLGNLSDAQLRELSKLLKNCKACQRDKLLKMIDAQLIDADQLMLCDKAGECDPEALIAVLCEGGDGDLAAALECNGGPGKGGVSRGRGDAAMTWQKDVEKGDAAFKEKVLPPAGVASLKQSRLAGISVGDPTALKPSGGSIGGALQSTQAGGGEAHAQTILPEHEKTVERYFSREKK
jgi:hypothetical protein